MIEAGRFLKSEYILKPSKLINNPEISIILPTYRRANNGLLQRGIESVLKQTFSNFELIVVDDGSVDETREVMKKYVKKDDRVIYVRNRENCALPALRVNQGILLSRGNYIAYQFDDDQWAPDALEKLYKEIVSHKELCMVYGSYESHNVKKKRRDVVDKVFNYYNLAKGNFIANNSVLHHKKIFEECGMYDPHLILRRVCDWDLWLRFSRKVPIYHISDVVSFVESRNPDSLAEIFPYNMELYRKYIAINRNEQLRPQNFSSYPLNDWKRFDVDDITEKLIYNQTYIKWDAENDKVKQIGRKRRGSVYMIKVELDASSSILVENFSGLIGDFTIIYLPVSEIATTKFYSSDILIFCRVLSIAETKTAEHLKRRIPGITIIYALDDNLFETYKRGPQFDYMAPGGSCYSALEWFVKNSDCCIVSTENLRAKIKKYNTTVQKITTNIRKEFLKKRNSYEKREIFSIFFAGGESRKVEFEQISEDLLKLMKKYKTKVKVTFFGYIPEQIQLCSDVETEYIPFSNSYYQYLNNLAHKKFNLLICPLEDNDFNKSKAPIKVLESCCCSAVGLYSDVDAYSCIIDKKNGFKIRKGESWFEKIEKIMKFSEKELGDIFNSALSMVMQNFTSESCAAQYRQVLISAQIVARMKKKSVLLVVGNIDEKNMESVITECKRYAELDIEVKLVASNSLARKILNKINQKEKISVITVDEKAFDNFVSLGEKNKQELTCAIAESGFVYSFEYYSTIEQFAKEQNIPYIIHSFGNSNLEQVAEELLMYLEQNQNMLPKYDMKEEKRVFEKKILGRQIESEMLTLSRPLGKGRLYRVFCDTNMLKGIALIFESRSSGLMECSATIEILYKGAILRTSSQCIRNRDYNQWTNFEFPPLVGCGGIELMIRVRLDRNRLSEAVLSVFEDKRNRSFLYKVWNKLNAQPKGCNTVYVDYRS